MPNHKAERTATKLKGHTASLSLPESGEEAGSHTRKKTSLDEEVTVRQLHPSSSASEEHLGAESGPGNSASDVARGAAAKRRKKDGARKKGCGSRS